MNFSGSVELKNQTFVLKNNKCMNITKRDCGNEILTAMVRAAGPSNDLNVIIKVSSLLVMTGEINLSCTLPNLSPLELEFQIEYQT